MIKVLIGINVLVFAAWQWAAYSNDLEFMLYNFLVSWSHVQEGYYWTLITSVFSHNGLAHFLINMFVLASFGPITKQAMGGLRFLGFYLTAGLIASLSHCLVSKFLIGQPEQPALGASGAIAGLVLVFALLFPKQKIYLFGIIPLPALFAGLAFVAIDIWGLVEQTQGGGLPIGHGAHLGGAFTGIVYYFGVLYPVRNQIRRSFVFESPLRRRRRSQRRDQNNEEY